LCGRFTLKVPVSEWLRSLFPGVDISSRFGWMSDVNGPRYNIAPTQSIFVMFSDSSGELRVKSMRWGLIPYWADSTKTAYSMFNARSETLLEKASFKPLLASHRCVVLADGYYEWKVTAADNKQPYWIHRASDEPFGMAGLWTINRKVEPGRETVSCTIITLASNDDTRDVHDRMPAILCSGDEVSDWLSSESVSAETRIARITQALEPGNLKLRAVSKSVNSVRSDDASLIEPLEKP